MKGIYVHTHNTRSTQGFYSAYKLYEGHIYTYAQHWEYTNIHQISMKDPVRVEVVDAVENLIQQRFDHVLRGLDRGLLAGFGCSMKFDDVL